MTDDPDGSLSAHAAEGEDSVPHGLDERLEEIDDILWRASKDMNDATDWWDTLPENNEKMIDGIRSKILEILKRTYDMGWYHAENESVAEIEVLKSQVEKMNDIFTKIRVTAVAWPTGGETSDDQPWLPEGLMLEIDSVMIQEHRT